MEGPDANGFLFFIALLAPAAYASGPHAPVQWPITQSNRNRSTSKELFFTTPVTSYILEICISREGHYVSTSEAVAQHLPFLRRYARALTGNQTSGDAYVAAAIEALIEEPTILSQARKPRVALYKLFTKIWNSVVVNGASEPAEV